MTVVVSMLRAVNVGGHNSIKMEALRDVYASLGLLNPTTHIQSGNVIFGTKVRNLHSLAKRIGMAIEERFGVRPEVILRSVSDLKDVKAKNPFAARNEIPPNKLLVTFLVADPGPEAVVGIRNLPSAPDELHLIGRELFAYFPNGSSGSKLPASAIDRVLRTPGTSRNWNTVIKLLDMAEKWGSPEEPKRARVR